MKVSLDHDEDMREKAVWGRANYMLAVAHKLMNCLHAQRWG
jgi:hypothetical protein